MLPFWGLNTDRLHHHVTQAMQRSKEPRPGVCSVLSSSEDDVAIRETTHVLSDTLGAFALETALCGARPTVFNPTKATSATQSRSRSEEVEGEE